MLHDLILAALVPAMALCHRVRGGLITLPVKATYWIWPVPGLLAYAAGASWPVALVWALGYLIWILPAWMVFLTRAVGAPVPTGQVMGSGPDVRLVAALSFGNAAFACFVRAAIYLIPLVVALACLDFYDGAGSTVDLLPLALIVVFFLPAYLDGYWMRPTDMSSVAEPLVGATWGASLLGFILLAS